MSEKHDAMWGADAGEYIAQQKAEIADLRSANKLLHGLIVNRDAEIARLRAIVADDGREKNRLSAIATGNGNQVARLQAALKAARPYVEYCAEPGGSDVATGVLREIDAIQR